MADRPVVLVWAKRLWRCGEPACEVTTWSEESEAIAALAVLTERARAEVARRVGPAYLAKELLRETYTAADTFDARGRLAVFYDHCRSSDVDELERLGRTVARWETPILRWHRTGLANATTGFRNFDNYRLRLLPGPEGRVRRRGGGSTVVAAEPAAGELAGVGRVGRRRGGRIRRCVRRARRAFRFRRFDHPPARRPAMLCRVH
jgi:Transposase